MWGKIQLHPYVYVGGALGGAVGGTLPSKAPPTQGGGGFGGRLWRTPKAVTASLLLLPLLLSFTATVVCLSSVGTKDLTIMLPSPDGQHSGRPEKLDRRARAPDLDLMEACHQQLAV